MHIVAQVHTIVIVAVVVIIVIFIVIIIIIHFFSQLIREVLSTADFFKASEVLIELGLVPLFSNIYSKCFYLDWTGLDGTPNLILANMRLIASVLLSVTDMSAVACQQVVDDGLSSVILEYLNDEKLSPDTLNARGIQICVHPLLTILHNVVQVCITALYRYLLINGGEVNIT